MPSGSRSAGSRAADCAAAAPGARWVTLILSDVLGNDPRVIASGPTVPGSANGAQPLATILDATASPSACPPPSSRALAATARPPRMVTCSIGTSSRSIADNATAVAAVADGGDGATGTRRGSSGSGPRVRPPTWPGDGSTACASAAPGDDVLLGGGEATVTVRGDGVGGRNTEFALAAAIALARARATARGWWPASPPMARTRIDRRGRRDRRGRNDRALPRGAGSIREAALARQRQPARVRSGRRRASRTGPTGTNVNDLYVAVRDRTG